MQGSVFRGKQRLVAIVAFTALAAVAVGSGAHAKHHGGRGGMDGSGSGYHLQMMMQWLGLDENQQVQVEQIIGDAMQQVRALQRPDWVAVVTEETFDERAAREVLSQTQQMQLQRHVIMLRAQHEIYHQVLNEEQQLNYREKMRQWRPGKWKMKHGQMRRPAAPQI